MWSRSWDFPTLLLRVVLVASVAAEATTVKRAGLTAGHLPNGLTCNGPLTSHLGCEPVFLLFELY